MVKTYIKTILKKLEKNGFEAYLVGGCIRDSFLKRKTTDYDIATNALPQDLIKLFGPPNRPILYGCYSIKHDDIIIDITTYRIELSYQNHKPEQIKYTDNLYLDAKRRDFTMNAIYVNKNGQKKDPYNGLKDLKNKKIVAIGDVNKKLMEDPIRILRAIRFQATLNFQLQKDLEIGIIECKDYLKSISKNLIKKELDGIFIANGFSLLSKYKIKEVLDLQYQNITYVPDLAGLWAQILNWEDFPLEKELKNIIKKVSQIIKCGTINLTNIYNYGIYECFLSADILGIQRQTIAKMAKRLPIKNRNDIHISIEEIKKLVGKEQIGQVLQEIETKILNGS